MQARIATAKTTVVNRFINLVAVGISTNELTDRRPDRDVMRLARVK